MKVITVPTATIVDNDLAYHLYRMTKIRTRTVIDLLQRRNLTGGTYRGTSTTFMHAHMIREELSDESRMRWRMPSIESITRSPVQEF